MTQRLRGRTRQPGTQRVPSSRSQLKPFTRIHLLHHLQHRAGNRAVTQLARALSVQPKLTITPAGDIYEQEADTVANEVIQTIHRGPERGQQPAARQAAEEEEELQMKRDLRTQRDLRAQRQEIPEEEELQMQRDLEAQRQEEEEELIQMHPDGSATTSESLTSAIQGSAGGGRGLPGGTRDPMEQAFGANFENVRLHTDAKADHLSRSMQALAFTVGPDIYFRRGAYDPASPSGERLMAHELTHVIQQGFAPTESEAD